MKEELIGMYLSIGPSATNAFDRFFQYPMEVGLKYLSYADSAFLPLPTSIINAIKSDMKEIPQFSGV